jgi:hypothetical protein
MCEKYSDNNSEEVINSSRRRRTEKQLTLRVGRENSKFIIKQVECLE